MPTNTIKKEQETFKPLSRSKEAEEYFYKKDQELVRQLRRAADRERKKQEREQRKALHWMKCPKCGGSMEEVELSCVKVDRCTECHGLYFDNGELEILIKMQKKEDFLSQFSQRWEEKLAKSKL